MVSFFLKGDNIVADVTCQIIQEPTENPAPCSSLLASFFLEYGRTATPFWEIYIKDAVTNRSQMMTRGKGLPAYLGF